MHCRVRIACLAACFASAPLAHGAPADFTLAQVLDYPYPGGLVAAESGEHLAWVVNLRGARNVWVADGPAFKPRQLTRFDQDDGQEITQLTFSPKADVLVFVRSGDHDANWPDELAPDPAASPQEPKVRLWAARLPDGTPFEVAEGDAPALSAQGRLAYVRENPFWTAPLAPT